MAELTEVADLLGGRGAAKALLGKDVLNDGCRGVTGSIGLLGTTASWHLMMDCDTLLTVGSNFPTPSSCRSSIRPVGGGRRFDRSGKWIGMRYPYELNLVGDAKFDAAGTDPRYWNASRTGPGARRSKSMWRSGGGTPCSGGR